MKRLCALLLLSLALAGGPCWGTTIDQFVLFGTDKADLGADTHVVNGEVGSNALAVFAKDSRVDGPVFADRVHAKARSRFGGDVHYNTLQQAREVVFEGALVTPLVLPVLTLPEVPSFTPGDTRIDEGQGAQVTLPPGDYDSIRIGKHSTVAFSGGHYQMRQLRIGADAHVTFLAPTEINVSQHIGLGNDGNYRGTAGVSAADVLLRYSGSGSVVVGHGTHLEANIFAPRASLSLGHEVVAHGAFLARKVRTGHGAQLHLDSAFATALVTVPDLIGLPQQQAAATLTGVGLVAGAIGERLSLLIPAGAVVGQQPPLGSEAAAGSAVDLTLSAPVPPGGLSVPDSWVGAWKLDITYTNNASGNIVAKEVITGDICPGDPVGLTLVPPAAECTGQFAGDELTVDCTGGLVLDACTVAGTLALTLAHDGAGLTGSGVWTSVASGICAPLLGIGGESFTVTGTQLSPDPGACAAPAASLTQKFLRHPLAPLLQEGDTP